MSDCKSFDGDLSGCSVTTGCIYQEPNCFCDVGYGSASQKGNDCTACDGNNYKAGINYNQCTACTIADTQASIAEGKATGNSYCKCTDLTKGVFNNNCITCQGQGQEISKQNGSCICKPGFTQDAQGACTAGCNSTGQQSVSGYTDRCTCAPGYGTNATEQVADIICEPCMRRQFKRGTGVEACKLCTRNKIGVNSSGEPNSTFTGPNIRCIAEGSCLHPLCAKDSNCEVAFCSLYGSACLYVNATTCACDEEQGYEYDENGNCVQQNQQQGSKVPIYVYIIAVVAVIIIAMLITAIVLYMKKRQQYPPRPKQPMWKVAPPIIYQMPPSHED